MQNSQLVKDKPAEQYHRTTNIASLAIIRAQEKQLRIFDETKRAYVLEDWYLDILIEEALVELWFSRYTVERCEQMNKERERRSLTEQALPTASLLYRSFK